MSDKLIYTYNYLRDLYRITRGRDKIKPQMYAEKKMLSIDLSNQLIAQAITENKPYYACRLGSGELGVIADYEALKIGIKRHYSMKKFDLLTNNAGFFPYDTCYIEKFSELYFDSISQADIIGVWYNILEEYILKKYAYCASPTPLPALEPWNSITPWSTALKGKRIVVIHPFSDSIEKQYRKRAYLFENENILPEFHLRTVRAVQTIAGNNDDRFSTWFDALNFMYDQVMSEDFDVAILGCGAYGLPLGAMLKKAEKVVIHMGGATQILFGIKGKRWDKIEAVSKMYNEYWVRPGNSEIVDKSNNIEGGCYW